MNKTAVIQARMNSGRLPGKVALPLDGVPVIQRIIRQVSAAECVGEIIVATPYWKPDDLIAHLSKQEGAGVYRGSEDDVLGRIAGVAEESGDNRILRVTADNPFVDPELIDEIMRRGEENAVDYVSNKMKRTFPLGVDAESFSTESLVRADRDTSSARHREHVNSYYKDNDDLFTKENVTVEDVYGTRDAFPGDKTLRMTLDEPADYQVYDRVFREVKFDEHLDPRTAAHYILEQELHETNRHVSQRFR